MTFEIQIPSGLGGSRAAFCREWCPEGSLAYTAEQISTGLMTVQRLWPERIEETAAQGGRGTGPAAVLVDIGLILATCESARFFTSVLERLRAGQRSAYAELVVGSSLRSVGVNPQFESGPGEPDVSCTVDGVAIAFEVYAPERSQASQDQLALVEALRAKVLSNVSNCRVEIEILDQFSQTDIPLGVQIVTRAVPSTWMPIENRARVRRIDQGQRLANMFDGDGARIRFAGDDSVKGPGSSIVVRWQNSDARAELKLQNKRAQVRDGVANVVTIDASAVGGVGAWPELIAELPGTDYDKIGAIAFFDQGSLGPPEAIRRRWRIVENPHAVITIPNLIVNRLESFDESTHFGIPAKNRLTML